MLTVILKCLTYFFKLEKKRLYSKLLEDITGTKLISKEYLFSNFPGMKHLLRAFLNDLGGNPNKKNAMNETVLHAACQLNQTKSFSVQERKASCVQLLLYWKGVTLAGGLKEKVDLGAQDKVGLHL